MTTFIELIAEDLLTRYGNNLRNLVVVFPNKRASLFLNQALAAKANKPVWAPRYQTISELFDSLTTLTPADQIMAVCELYKVYKEQVTTAESLDRFYGWGEIMLADFDDIDKHLADAHKLFSNIQDIKEIELDTFLSPEQEQALSHFFEGFSIDKNTLLKERFLELWNNMSTIYEQFNHQLREKGMAYEGALYKDVALHLEERFNMLPNIENTTYIFIGFNVLNDVEHTLMSFLQNKQKALFYWDYDNMFLKEGSHREAGEFIRRNLNDFPNALPDNSIEPLTEGHEIEFVATTSENAQARYVTQWLGQHITPKESETAVVLCNEKLLQPVLHALPDNDVDTHINAVNITMGFPLTETPIYSYINALLTLQTEGYDKDLRQFREMQKNIVMRHPYYNSEHEDIIFNHHNGNMGVLQYLSEALELTATQFATAQEGEEDNNAQSSLFNQLYIEALYRAHQVITRFTRLTEEGALPVEITTLQRLIRTVLSTTTIPFHGEPAVGLQVMGLLETRNLNFKHILMLSVNEGHMPKNANDTSFIPYNLRAAFGLTTTEHKIAVYAFYFYRLLQHNEHITYVYNTSTSDSGKNEMSRFLRQLLAETDLPIGIKTIQADTQLPVQHVNMVEKTPHIMEILTRLYACNNPKGRALSPSALNTYLDCPLKFFHQQIAKVKTPQTAEDGIDAALFGSIFHQAADYIYERLSQADHSIRKTDIAQLLKSPATIEEYVAKAFKKLYFDANNLTEFYNGQLIIARKVMVKYLESLLKKDAEITGLKVLEREKEHKRRVKVPVDDKEVEIYVGGIIDRIDSLLEDEDGQGSMIEKLRILDYKTGGKPTDVKHIQHLTAPGNDRAAYPFQIFLYAWIMSYEQNRPIEPALFFVHRSNAEDYDPRVKFDKAPLLNFNDIKQDFEEELMRVLQEIFNPNIPFTQTTDTKKCDYCDLKELCYR